MQCVVRERSLVVRRFHPHTHSLFALVICSPDKGTNSMGTVNVHSSIRHFVDVLPALVVAVLVRAVVVEVNVVTASLASFAATPVKTRER